MSLWADPGDPGGPFGTARKGSAHLEAVQRLKEWTRMRFALADEDVVIVSENATTLPGFPPRQTAVAFWTADGTRHHFSVYKPAEQVTLQDVPPAWLKPSLALSEGIECACC
jgi:hypothetical protein